jgi:nucleotide-binding universal stress UspA family protein
MNAMCALVSTSGPGVIAGDRYARGVSEDNGDVHNGGLDDLGPREPDDGSPRTDQPVFERGTDGPKVIVVGVDGSESSWRAAAYAAGLARRQGSLLAMVYVQPLGLVTATGMAVSMAEATAQIAEEIVAEARAAAERLTELYRVRWEFHTFPGDPFSGLVKAADDLQADAVVVGASEQAGHRIIGSLAVRLVKTARWPVTVVP